MCHTLSHVSHEMPTRLTSRTVISRVARVADTSSTDARSVSVAVVEGSAISIQSYDGVGHGREAIGPNVPGSRTRIGNDDAEVLLASRIAISATSVFRVRLDVRAVGLSGPFSVQQEEINVTPVTIEIEVGGDRHGERGRIRGDRIIHPFSAVQRRGCRNSTRQGSKR